MDNLFDIFYRFLPVFVLLVVICTLLFFVNWLLLHRKGGPEKGRRFSRRVAVFLLSAIGMVVVILSLPVSSDIRHQLLGLLGLLFSGIIALSSTTIVSNILAGLMLRAVKSFRPGDFIRVKDQFGRVIRRGLFYAEIQTEDRDLATIPNLYMISHPVTVTHASGTIVSAGVSLGYDISHERIEALLMKAADGAQLEDPFVQIKDLGDYSVTYRIAGFLPEVKQLLTARSNLRKMMLDTLHGAGIEIVSPAFMNQRRLPENMPAIPKGAARHMGRPAEPEDQIPEELIFDKAEEAEKKEDLKTERDALLEKITALETQLKEAPDDRKQTLEAAIGGLGLRVKIVDDILEKPDPDRADE